MIIKIFTKSNKVQVEDCNVKKSLKSRTGADVEIKGEGKVMTIETQVKSLVGHWLELSKRIR